jgi:hypothetical protein
VYANKKSSCLVYQLFTIDNDIKNLMVDHPTTGAYVPS